MYFWEFLSYCKFALLVMQECVPNSVVQADRFASPWVVIVVWAVYLVGDSFVVQGVVGF